MKHGRQCLRQRDLTWRSNFRFKTSRASTVRKCNGNHFNSFLILVHLSWWHSFTKTWRLSVYNCDKMHFVKTLGIASVCGFMAAMLLFPPAGMFCLRSLCRCSFIYNPFGIRGFDEWPYNMQVVLPVWTSMNCLCFFASLYCTKCQVAEMFLC